MESESGQSVFSAVVERTPFHREALGAHRAKYPILRLTLEAIWITRLGSPSAWILSLFKDRYSDGRLHARPAATDFLMLSWFGLALGLALFADTLRAYSHAIAVLCIILIVDLVRSNLHLMLVRPSVDLSYRPYNTTRSLILCGTAYITATLLFASLYNLALNDEFTQTLDANRSIALAVGIATTGASGISPTTDGAYNTVSVQSFISIVFLGIIMSSAVSRLLPIHSSPEPEDWSED